MTTIELIKKKLDEIETAALAVDGCSPTFTVKDIKELLDSIENIGTNTITRPAPLGVETVGGWSRKAERREE